MSATRLAALPSQTTVTRATCPGLNQLPAGRVDPNAVNVLNLYPEPNNGLQQFASSPNLYEHSNTFDIRTDYNPNEKNQIFFRFSYADDPIYIPGIFGGVADGGSFQQGVQTAKSDQAVAAYTRVFNQNTINVVRGGFAHLHTTRFGPVGDRTGNSRAIWHSRHSAGQAKTAAFPHSQIGNLANLGSNNFLPSDEVSQTFQVTDDFTKIYGKHNFKMGIEYQPVKFSTLQPAWSRGQFQYNGGFTDIPNLGSTGGGLAQMLLPPTAATYPGAGGFDYSGGADGIYASNINKTYDAKKYFASYFQDDWKITSKLTLNLGLRWDYFGPINETNGGQANFVPYGAPDGIPAVHYSRHGQIQQGIVYRRYLRWHRLQRLCRSFGAGWHRAQ